LAFFFFAFFGNWIFLWVSGFHEKERFLLFERKRVMKKALIGVCVLLMVGLVSFGCKKKEEPKPNVTKTIEDVQTKTEEAADKAKKAVDEAADATKEAADKAAEKVEEATK